MTGAPSIPSGSSLPLSDWLALMVAEIERKDAEAKVAAEERQRRAPDEPGAARPPGSADVA
jgi:hypothetical protein